MNLRMLTAVVLVTLAMNWRSGFAADPLEEFFEDEWEQFKITYNRAYASDYEESQRFRVFVDNTRLVLAHNAAFLRGQYSFDVGINQFGDLTNVEVSAQRNGFNRTQQIIRERGYPFGSNHHVFETVRFRTGRATLPDYVNWVEAGAVGPVVDQGECGSCWAFSAVGALEAQHFRKTGDLVQLSVQQLVDCARDNGNNGCNGGVMEEAFEYVKKGGLALASDYPFVEEQNDCDAEGKGKNTVASDSGYKRIPPRNEKKLMKALANVGPVAVAIDASQSSFQFYKGGVYYEPKCAAGQMNHGVLVVGYGTDETTGEEYWLVKNSWGTGWGENGYIRMARNRMNNCCIACYGAYPLD